MAKRLFPFAIFDDETSVGALIFDTLDHKRDSTTFVPIRIFGDDNFLRFSAGAILTVRLRRRFASERRARADEVDAVEMFDKLDDVATHIALPAIPHALLGVDREAVLTAAFRAWPAALNDAAQSYAASRYLVLDLHGACFGAPIFEGGG